MISFVDRFVFWMLTIPILLFLTYRTYQLPKTKIKESGKYTLMITYTAFISILFYPKMFETMDNVAVAIISSWCMAYSFYLFFIKE